MKMLITITDLICALLLLLFLYTAVSKLFTHDAFQFVLFLSPSLRPFATLISWLIPIAEILICICLFLPPLRTAGLLGSFILLLMFTLYLIYMILFTTDHPCACGGVISSLSWPAHIIFNIFFMGLAATGLILRRKIHNLHDMPP